MSPRQTAGAGVRAGAGRPCPRCGVRFDISIGGYRCGHLVTRDSPRQEKIVAAIARRDENVSAPRAVGSVPSVPGTKGANGGVGADTTSSPAPLAGTESASGPDASDGTVGGKLAGDPPWSYADQDKTDAALRPEGMLLRGCLHHGYPDALECPVCADIGDRDDGRGWEDQ